MTHLLDRIRAEGIKPIFPTEDGRHQADRLTQELRASTPVVVVIDNVADYFDSLSSKEWAPLAEATNAAPPFPAFWMEWHVRRSGERRQIGALFTCLIEPDAASARLLQTFNLEEEQMAWVLHCEVIEANRRHGIQGPIGMYTIPVGKDGSLPWAHQLDDPDTPADRIPIDRQIPEPGSLFSDRKVIELAENLPLSVHDSRLSEDIVNRLHKLRQLDEELKAAIPDVLEGFASGGLVYVICALLGVTFMHCRNVEMVQQRPNPKLARKYLKRKGVEQTRWHVLKIEPMRKVLRTEGGMDEGNSLAKALHICRGHFATYTPERPLFGRPQSGLVTVWKPMHVKGRIDRGEDHHDYEVKAPEGAPDPRQLEPREVPR